MTKTEALTALAEGKTLTHSYFSDDEWIKREGNLIRFEDGCSILERHFWEDRTGPGFEDNWSIYKEETVINH